MSRVDISSIGFAKVRLPNGMLQTDNALSNTLQTVKDNLGNSSTLLLSTVDAQVNSTLRIHTDNTELLDIEDSLANNRFNINRSTQQINLDFASNPTLATTQVGAIRTYQDGVNLSNAASFFKNGNVSFGATNNFYWDNVNSRLGIGTTSPSESLTIFNGNGTYGTSGQSLGLGSYLKLGYYYNVGILNNSGQPMSFNASSFYFNNTYSAGLPAMVGIRGSGSTSATTSFLVQNSSGTAVFQIKDDSSVSLPSNAGNNTLAIGGQVGTSKNGVGVGYTSGGNVNVRGGLFNNPNTDVCDLYGVTNSVMSWIGNTVLFKAGNNGASFSQPSALVSIDSTTQGFLPPRMTQAQILAIASPAIGLMAYNTDLDCPVFYSAAGWRKISHSAM